LEGARRRHRPERSMWPGCAEFASGVAFGGAIRYFQPEFNKEYKDTFPNLAHKSYSEWYDDAVEVMDDLGVGERLDAVQALRGEGPHQFDAGRDAAPVVVGKVAAVASYEPDRLQGDHVAARAFGSRCVY
jgi:hypothetical protein